MTKHILVVTSTFPTSDSDPVPAFVRDQVIAIKKEFPNIVFSVLAPYDEFSYHSMGNKLQNKDFYKEYRFHYFWPFCLEKLTGRGIVPTLRRNPLYYFLIPFLFFAEFFALLKYSKELKPDIMYAHWFAPQAIVAGLVSEITGIPFVYTSHSSDVAIMRRIPFAGASAVRYFSKKAKAITVVSRRSLEKLQSFFESKEWDEIYKKVAIIPMGVSNIELGKLNKPVEKKVGNILFLGRLEEKKGVQYLLPAFATICKDFPKVTLTIAGDGSWRDKLQKQAKILEIPDESIKFVGDVRGDKKAKLIDDAGIFIVPSIITNQGDAEGLPVALLEGLAAAKICISTYESGADDIIENGMEGFLVPQKNVVALVYALEKALKLSLEAQLKMQKRAQIVSHRFLWPVIARLHHKALFDLRET